MDKEEGAGVGTDGTRGADQSPISGLDSDLSSSSYSSVSSLSSSSFPTGGRGVEILQAMQMDEGAVAAVTAALEAEDGCIRKGAVVGGEVSSGRVRRHCRIILDWW